MPNRNYIAGRAYEYKLMKLLIEQGWSVVRAAGSHGPYDVIAYKSNGPVRMIQVKRVKTHTALHKLEKSWTPEWTLADHVQGKTTYITELWVWMDREGWHIFDTPAS